jgi:hypothetical protein
MLAAEYMRRYGRTSRPGRRSPSLDPTIGFRCFRPSLLLWLEYAFLPCLAQWDVGGRIRPVHVQSSVAVVRRTPISRRRVCQTSHGMAPTLARGLSPEGGGTRSRLHRTVGTGFLFGAPDGRRHFGAVGAPVKTHPPVYPLRDFVPKHTSRENPCRTARVILVGAPGGRWHPVREHCAMTSVRFG